MRKFNIILFVSFFVTGFNIELIFCKKLQTFKNASATTVSFGSTPDTGSQHPKLSSHLNPLYRLCHQNKDYTEYADQARPPFTAERINVTMLPNISHITDVIDEAILARVKHSFCIAIENVQLKKVVTNVAGFKSIELLVQSLYDALISESVDLINNDEREAQCIIGAGVKAAIID